jgi:3-phenylpropionate/trans-cinnamate dioxygenase ferredoxin subunit
MADWLQVARAEDMPPGTIVRVENDGESIAVVNLGGEFFAVSNICTHMEVELHEGELEADGELTCPAHGAKFDVRSGEVLGPPAFEDLPTYAVEVEDGVVYVASEPNE